MSRTTERRRAQDELIFDVTEDLLIAMEDAGVTKAQLARMVNKSKSRISQMLSGEANMTLRTLASICFEIGTKIDFRIGDEFSVRDPRSKPEFEEVEFSDFEISDNEAFRRPSLKLVSCNDEPAPHYQDWSETWEAAL